MAIWGKYHRRLFRAWHGGIAQTSVNPDRGLNPSPVDIGYTWAAYSPCPDAIPQLGQQHSKPASLAVVFQQLLLIQINLSGIVQ
jgi:hypothetical protein